MSTPSRPPGGNAATPRFAEVTVLLGDPTLPDVTKVDARYSAEDLEAVERLRAALSQLPEYRFRYLNDHRTLLRDLLASPPAFVLNLCDTGLRNVAALELHVPALLEALEIPYSGAPPGCLSRCFDKGLVRAVAAAHDIPVPAESFLRRGDPGSSQRVTFPALVKPNTGDGSVGITADSVVRNAAELGARIAALREELPGRDLLVQEFLEGPEYGICLIGNPGGGFVVLPPLEIDYSGLDAGLPQILGYESKTLPDSPYWRQLRYREAKLDAARLAHLRQHCELLFERLELRDYGRFDFRVDSRGTIRLLEVNPNPAWCWDGKMNFMAGFASYSEPDLFRLLLETARRRYGESQFA